MIDLHYGINPVDYAAWGAKTLCGAKYPVTRVRAEVTCGKCLRHTEWSVAKIRDAARRGRYERRESD